jgi:hypothetical protein
LLIVWNKEELSQQWKKCIIARIYKQGNKADCNNCRAVSLLSTVYSVQSFFRVFFLSSLSRCVNEIIVDHGYGFPCNRSTSDPVMGQYFSYL